MPRCHTNLAKENFKNYTSGLFKDFKNGNCYLCDFVACSERSKIKTFETALVSLIESDDVDTLVAAFKAQFWAFLQAHDVLDGEAGFHKRM